MYIFKDIYVLSILDIYIYRERKDLMVLWNEKKKQQLSLAHTRCVWRVFVFIEEISSRAQRGETKGEKTQQNKARKKRGGGRGREREREREREERESV